MLVLATAMASPADAALDAAGKTALAQYRLSADTLHRMEAVTQEAKAQGLPMLSHFSLATHSASIASLTRRVNAMPHVPSLLAEHGLSAHAYVLASLAMMQSAMATRMHGSPIVAKIVGSSNPANQAFYEQHQAAIRKLMAMSQ